MRLGAETFEKVREHVFARRSSLLSPGGGVEEMHDPATTSLAGGEDSLAKLKKKTPVKVIVEEKSINFKKWQSSLLHRMILISNSKAFVQ